VNKFSVIWTWLILSWFLITWNVQESYCHIKNEVSYKVSNIISFTTKKEISNKLWEKYYNIIEFNESGWLEYLYDVEYFSPIEQRKVLEQFSEILSKYPDFLIKKAYIRKIYILKSIKNQKWEEIWWFSIYWEFFLNWGGTNLSKFDHELFHNLDNRNMDDDNLWKNIFNNSKIIDINFTDELNQEVEWYANLYWKEWWKNEDQATISEYLLNSKKKKRLLERAKDDNILKYKIMLITWCYFDEEVWIFTRNLTKQEYIKLFNSDDFEYYWKWSRNNWKLYMDYNFWNRL